MNAFERAVVARNAEACGVKDLYTGDCKGCGECCSRFLPLTWFDVLRLKGHIERTGIKPRELAENDFRCPFLAEGMCSVYEARPEICRVYRCDRHKSGDFRMPYGFKHAHMADMAEVFGGEATHAES